MGCVKRGEGPVSKVQQQLLGLANHFAAPEKAMRPAAISTIRSKNPNLRHKALTCARTDIGFWSERRLVDTFPLRPRKRVTTTPITWQMPLMTDSDKDKGTAYV